MWIQLPWISLSLWDVQLNFQSYYWVISSSLHGILKQETKDSGSNSLVGHCSTRLEYKIL